MDLQEIPQSDLFSSLIELLEEFWQTHDITDFEEELAEVTEPVFVRKEEQT
jgi:hypothetical protein